MSDYDRAMLCFVVYGFMDGHPVFAGVLLALWVLKDVRLHVS